MNRPELSDAQLLRAIESATIAVARRVEQSGRGACISNYEALGHVVEHVESLTESVRQNDPADVANNLMDMAATCIFAVSSMFMREDELIAASEEDAKAE